ncbi:MAG: hypothetical protein V4510_08120 [bacterium]
MNWLRVVVTFGLVAFMVQVSHPDTVATPNGMDHGGLTMASVGSTTTGPYVPSYEFIRNTTATVAALGLAGTLSLPGDANTTESFALTTTDLFVPGGNVIRYWDANGTFTTQTFDAHTYKGSVSGIDGSWARFLVSPDGIYGMAEGVVVTPAGTPDLHCTWSYERSADQSGISAPDRRMTVEKVCQPTSCPEIAANVAFAPSLPCRKGPSPGGIPPLPAGLKTDPKYKLVLETWADHNYPTYAGDFASRIASAVNAGESMWEDETLITVVIDGINVSPYTYWEYECGGAGSGLGDSGLKTFTGWVPYRPGPNAYVLFQTWNAPGGGVSGCAPGPDLATHGTADNHEAALAVTAKDFYWSDSYAPDKTSHLALAVHHELTHNTGEPSHPSNNYGCGGHDNLMNNGAAYYYKILCRVGSTECVLENYSYTKLYPI